MPSEPNYNVSGPRLVHCVSYVSSYSDVCWFVKLKSARNGQYPLFIILIGCLKAIAFSDKAAICKFHCDFVILFQKWCTIKFFLSYVILF